MNESGKSHLVRSDVLLQWASILAFWAIALVVWWASLWHADAFSSFGDDLPGPTNAVIWSAQAGVPFILAALFSAVVFSRLRRPTYRSAVVIAWLLFMSLLCASFAVIGMTAPMVRLCGELIPGWPSTIADERIDGR